MRKLKGRRLINSYLEELITDIFIDFNKHIDSYKYHSNDKEKLVLKLILSSYFRDAYYLGKEDKDE